MLAASYRLIGSAVDCVAASYRLIGSAVDCVVFMEFSSTCRTIIIDITSVGMREFEFQLSKVIFQFGEYSYNSGIAVHIFKA